MSRILADGSFLTLFRNDLHPRPKEVLFYDIPDPVFRSDLPRKEYRPALFTLRKGNVLTRQDLHTGAVFDNIHLGNVKGDKLISNFMQDMLIVKSPKLSYSHAKSEFFFTFNVFELHPFTHIATFTIDSKVFPAPEDRKVYGKLRTVEIHDGLLLVMTNKDHCLIYSADDIIESKRVKNHLHGIDSLVYPETSATMVTKSPPLLYAIRAHMDIMGMGSCPWAYIQSVCDTLLEVREMVTDELLINGQVVWEERNCQVLAPDYMIFFPDDSNRLLHTRNNAIRVLDIRETDGKRELIEVFCYPERNSCEKPEEIVYSRSGRLLKTKFSFDWTLNRAVAYDVELDLMILVIVEARRSTTRNFSYLYKAVFYDSITYEFLHEFIINETMVGDIETGKFSIHMDRDVLHIMSYQGMSSRIFTYRLSEVNDKANTLPKNGNVPDTSRRKRKSHAEFSGNSSDDEIEGLRRQFRRRGANQSSWRQQRSASANVYDEGSSSEWTP